jgi:hypothetical protein
LHPALRGSHSLAQGAEDAKMIIFLLSAERPESKKQLAIQAETFSVSLNSSIFLQ